MITNYIVIQLLEKVTNDHVKIFDKNECFILLNMEIIKVYKDQYFSEHTEKECSKALCAFHDFKDNPVALNNKSKKNKNQRNIVCTKNFIIQNEKMRRRLGYYRRPVQS